MAAVAQTLPDMIVPATSSPNPQDLKAVSLDLAALRQRVDQLAAQVAAGQEQMTRDFTTKLYAAGQDILNKVSAHPPQPRPASLCRRHRRRRRCVNPRNESARDPGIIQFVKPDPSKRPILPC